MSAQRRCGVRASARAVLTGGALLMILSLGGCATSSTPAPEAASDFHNTYNYLPVNDVPPHDDQRPVLSVEQQEKARKELEAARDRQLPAALKGTPAKPAAAKPAVTSPAPK
ncbi:hypothetical protein ACQR1I_16135 [Bradyrhizobium sp. HKCCYLS2038]